jgi:sigma-B regulation protein RsbU (phosphoserine phosphatase)
MGIVTTIVVFIGWLLTMAGGAILFDELLERKAKGVEQTLTEVYVASVNTVPLIADNLQHPDRLQAIMKRVVELNPHIRSCGVSFRENHYPQKGRWFCPYARRSDSDSTVTVQTLGSHTNDYLTAEWFQEGMHAKDGYWSKPFFDGSDHTTPLVAYLLPIRDERDSTVAVLGVDISLEALSRDVSSVFYDGTTPDRQWTAEERAYFFVVDSTGTFLVHADKQHIIHKNLLHMATATAVTTDDYAADRILHDAGSSGYLVGNDSYDEINIEGEDVIVCYTAIAHTPWKMVFVLPVYFVDLVFYGIAGLLLFFILIGLAVVFFVGRKGIKKSSEPLKQLALSADEVAQGHFDTQLPDIRSHDEIHLLRDSFDNMQHSLTRYTEQLKATTAMKASMESELKIAHDIQMDMLPKTFPPYPERNDVDIYGLLTPAKAVGGDLFDFYIRDEQLYFCIGDVSGKGIPASMFMAVTRSLFRNISAHVAAPERIAYALNNALSENNESSMFVTLFAGVLHLPTGQLRYCNAGHNAPLLVGSGVSTLPCQPNLPLGIVADYPFEPQETRLAAGTTIFLFTDGLNEAENAHHEQFGDQRILDVATRLSAQHAHQPTNITNAMRHAVHTFVNGAEQSDDLTMLAIQIK